MGFLNVLFLLLSSLQLLGALHLQGNSCPCLAWRDVLESKERTCFDLPGVCKAMQERSSECSPFNFCWVSSSCGNSFRKHPIFGTEEAGPISFRSCDGVKGVEVNTMLSVPDSTRMAVKFSNIHSNPEHVFIQEQWNIDEETGLRNPGCPPAPYDSLQTHKNLIAWARILESRWSTAPMKDHMSLWWAKQEQKSPPRVLFISIGDAVDFYEFKKNFPDISRNAEFYGCDLSQKMLKLGMQALSASGDKIDLTHCDGQNLAFQDDRFDIVWHVGSVNAWPSPGKGLAEFWRVLKPGGIVGIIDENIQYDTADPEEAAGMKAIYALHGQKMLHTPVEFIPSPATNVFSYNIDDFIYWLTFSKP